MLQCAQRNERPISSSSSSSSSLLLLLLALLLSPHMWKKNGIAAGRGSGLLHDIQLAPPPSDSPYDVSRVQAAHGPGAHIHVGDGPAATRDRQLPTGRAAHGAGHPVATHHHPGAGGHEQQTSPGAGQLQWRHAPHHWLVRARRPRQARADRQIRWVKVWWAAVKWPRQTWFRNPVHGANPPVLILRVFHFLSPLTPTIPSFSRSVKNFSNLYTNLKQPI